MVAALIAGVLGTMEAQNVPTIIVSGKKKQEKVVIDPEMTRNLAQLNERFAGIAKLWESRELETARSEYRKILGAMSAPPHYRSYAHLRIAQSYVVETNNAAARAEYEKIMTSSEYPEVHRYEAEEILKEMDRVAKGLPARDVMASRTKIPPVGKFAVEFFVAPTGNDANPGTRQQPFASLEKARDAIRALKAKGALPGPVCVRLLPGEYPMKRTLELTAADSGTETAPIVYRADQKDAAVLYGGARLSGFVLVSDAAILKRLPAEAQGKVFQCDLNKLGITDFGRITVAGYGKPQQPEMLLYCNGQKQTLARWPNSGYVEVKKVINPGSVKSNIQPVFEYADERHARWTKAEDPWLYSFFVYNWVPRRIPIRHIDTNAKTIVIDPYGHADRDGIGTVPWQKTLPYFALNMLEEIDSPGEWYLDRGKGILYLYPPSNPDSSVIELGMLSHVMVSMDKVSHVRMEHLKWDLARGDCMTIKSGSNILLAGCSFSRFGNHGINVPDGDAVGILGCDFSYIEDSAARINGGDRKRLVPGGNFIENCLFANLPGTAVGINGVGNRVAHNQFVDIEGSAVYGIGGLLGNDHVIEYNDVIRCGLPLDKHPGAAGDMGVMGSYGDPTYRAIYRYNRFSEIGVNLDGGHAAIRLDDAISGMVIYGNSFDRCGDNVNPKGGMGALNYNAGRDNICDNNVFIRCPKVQTGGFNPNNDCWERILKKGTMTDPLYLARYPDLKNYQKDGVIDKSGFNHLWRNIIVDCPVIVRPGFGAPIESFDIMDLAVYTNQDPGFVAMAKGDYRLAKNAPVLNRIGFRPIPVEEIGLYKDEYRATWPAVAMAGADARAAAAESRITPLFDGKTLEGWKSRGPATFKVEDGMIVGTTADAGPPYSGGNSFLCTMKEYGDFVLEFEVKCDPELNSGVQFRSHAYEKETEVEINGSKRKFKPDCVFGYQFEIASPWAPGSGAAGWVYDEARRGKFLAGPAGNKPTGAFKVNEWNRCRVIAQGDHIRTFINDVAIADLHDTADAKGFIGLQVHEIKKGTGPFSVRWRNIMIRELKPDERL
jgi:hypothetical protein